MAIELEKLLIRLGLDSSDVEKGSKKASDAIKGVGDRAKDSHGKFVGLGSGMGSAGKAATKLASPLATVQARLKSTAGGFNLLGAAMAALGGVSILALGKKLIGLGMDSEETRNLFTVSMGGMTSAADRWVAAMNRSLGLNKTQLEQNLGMWQSMFTAMGIGEKAALGMGQGLTKLAYDMSSFYNLAPDEMFQKLQSGISGEVEPLRRLGIVVNDTTVKTWALTNGLAKQGDELSDAQKAYVRYRLILEQTSNAQGDLARTATSPANQLRLLKERATELGTEIGQKMMPTVSSALVWMNNDGLPRVRKSVQALENAWVNMSEETKRRVIAIAALLVGGGPLFRAFGILIPAIGFVKVAFTDLARHTVKAVKLMAAAVTALAVSIPGKIVIVAGSILTIFDLASKGLAELLSVAFSTFGEGLNKLGVEMAGMPGVLGEAGRQMANLGASAMDTGKWLSTRGFATGEWWFTRLAKVAQPAVDELDKSFDEVLGGVEELTGGNGVDGLLASIEKLGAVNIAEWAQGFDDAIGYAPKIASDAELMREAAANYQEGLSDYKPPPISQDEWDKMAGVADDAKEKAKKAGVSVADLTKALVATSAPARVAAEAVAYWSERVEATTLAIEANKDQLKAAQDEMQGMQDALRVMQDHLSGLNDELSIANKRLDEFAKPRLTGMGEIEMQLNAVGDALARMDLADASGQTFESILSQYPLLTAGAAAYLATLPQTRDGLEATQKQLQALQGVQFDEKLRILGSAAEGPRTEMPYETAMAGIIQYRARIGELTGAIASQEAAIRGQEGAIRAQERAIRDIQRASEDLARAQQWNNEQLAIAKTNQDLVIQSLTAAYTWLLKDREEVEKLGPAGVAAAAKVDAETVKLLKGLSAFAEENTATNQLQVTAMNDAYTIAVDEIKAKLAEIPKDFDVTVHVRTVQEGSTELPGRASGGRVEKGKPYMVGEEGPEPFIPDQNGTILPNSTLRAPVATSGGGIDAQELARIIQSQPVVLMLDGREIARSTRGHLLAMQRDNGGRLFR